MHALRDMLFGDAALDQWPPGGVSTDEAPWSLFAQARDAAREGRIGDACGCWHQVLRAPDLESRHYLQAWCFLRAHGETAPKAIAQAVLGVVVEVGLPEGLDILAAYADFRARYINHTGSGMIWERPDASLDGPIGSVLSAGETLAGQIGPWEGERPPAPPTGQVRLSMLTPSGMHFGQADMGVMAREPLGRPLFEASTRLLQAIGAKRPQGR